MEKKGVQTNLSTFDLMGSLVEGAVDNEVDVNDPIIRYLVKNDGWNNAGYDSDDNDDSPDIASDDSDIEVLIEEHILLEKLKQVTGKKHDEGISSKNNSDNEVNDETLITLGIKNDTELLHLKTNIEEAMQINLKWREELLALENQLVRKYREAYERKNELLKEMNLAEAKVKLQHSLFADRFLDTFRAPYFKFDGLVAPSNDDFFKISSTIIPYISDKDEWSTNNIVTLCTAVRKYLIYEKTQVKRDGNRSKALMPKNICSRNEFIYLREAPLYDLVKDREDDSMDWKVISNFVKRPVSEYDCRQMWSLFVKSSVKDWLPEEHSKLLKLTKQYNLRNWDKIAAELNTGRSGFDCFYHNQCHFSLQWNEGKWSKEDEDYLNKVIKESKIGNFISWDKVTYFLDSKYVEQVYAKWQAFQAPHLTKGPFTELEDKILLGLIHKYGANLRTVANIMKNRSIAQISARYNDHLVPQLSLKLGEWTVQEDEKLLRLVKEHGEANWATIAIHFETRSRVQIRHRYRLLKQKLANNPNLNLNLLSRPKRPTSKKRKSINKIFYNKVISTKAKNVKYLMDNESKQYKRTKAIDLKLTQYFQMKFKTENIDQSGFLERKQPCRSDSVQPGTAKKQMTNNVNLMNSISNDETSQSGNSLQNKSLVSSLLYSSVALRNILEAADTDVWSQKDRQAFHKGILELYSTDSTIADLNKWHNVFCSLFSAPALLSHLSNIEEWKGILSRK